MFKTTKFVSSIIISSANFLNVDSFPEHIEIASALVRSKAETGKSTIYSGFPLYSDSSFSKSRGWISSIKVLLDSFIF